MQYLALDGGPPGFKPDFSCLILLRILSRSIINFIYGTFTLFGWTFQIILLSITLPYESPTTPTMQA